MADLYDRVARDFPSMDLSPYTFVDLMLMSTPEDHAPSSTCLNTSSPFGFHSSEISLLAILKDQPLEAMEVEKELDVVGEELNGVLTMDRDALEESEIAGAPADS